ncbi:ABC transporter substrate-binding protein [Hydrogenophaga taeniospiralis]|uniref:heme/hemin ABC transporter substrate-binding protein n=1 Tax=Hydrogenophaga taeniospiralis TaxID=65656 RepID=UPI001CFA1038|nr:ABC transporter substrate-binding protein [Hydrogenophaga taeniospiralis]MCB4362724.1 ABC transporter substrate-binding protein [Hydrogenophaga taeniospiralis]
MKSPLSTPPFGNTSRRSALQKLSGAALAGSAVATAGWPWPLRAAPAAAPQPQTPGPGSASPGAEPARAPGVRLVTVGGGITEVVYALGAQDLLVGTDSTSLYPPAAQTTPKVGYMRQLSAEGLLALRPDALIAGTDAGPPVVLEQLRGAGVTVELIAADHSWGEVGRKVAAVGRATGREADARALQQRLDARWAAVTARVRQTARSPQPKVLFVLSHTGSPMVSGEQTAADALIRFMGARNALGGFKGYRPMTAEAMAQAAPDVILMTTQGIEAIGGEAAFWQRPELALTPAHRRRALLHLDALELLGFGPRLPDVVERLHQQVVLA